jgi:hypothetical protein
MSVSARWLFDPDRQFSVSSGSGSASTVAVRHGPHSEHDLGAVEVVGRRSFRKMDSSDRDLRGHPSDRADPGETARVLTIMSAEIY